ncbi:hypothetical protein NC651_007564 [Populus alba x Populus x berolinensis]|nr:hypothetical protein NC651_007564 [Populus alba x Populus x berolinensis]
MIKAAKKLKKFWPRKKKRKKTLQYHESYYHHPPSSCHCCSSYPTAPTQPSAPPLPPWLEPELTYEAVSAPGLQSLPEMAHPSQIQVPSQEIVMETNSHISNIAVISAISGSKSCLWSAC